jgi:hypothetical protein
MGSDLSETVIKRAKNVYANEKNVNFIVDDILNSNLKEIHHRNKTNTER